MRLSAIYGTSLLGVILCAANSFALPPLTASIDLPPSLRVAPNETAATGGNLEEATLNLLAQAKAANQDLYSTLQSFVCKEQIERFKGPLSGTNREHIDTVTTKVSFENGIEHYSDILQDERPRMAISSVSGAWSEGEYGTLLQQTQILLSTQPVKFRMYTEFDGVPAAIYTVDVAAQNSPWDLEVDRQHYRIPFRTEVWVSRATGRMLKIERVSTRIPPRVGISEMRWGVTLQTVRFDEKSWLLPKTGNYAVLYGAKGRREWNELQFSEYHRYGSEVALRFQ